MTLGWERSFATSAATSSRHVSANVIDASNAVFDGTQPSFLAQVRVTRDDGSMRVLAATDSTWEAADDGALVDSGIYAGEHQDLRRSPTTWTPVRVGAAAREGYENVPGPEARIAAPVRRIAALPVAAVLASPSGGRILDFGQNLADVIDDRRAYRALLETLSAHAPERVDAVRTGTVWGARRPLSTALMFTPPPVLEAIDRAVREATA
ncbi:alpha-L-rhamnosidase N-terminal domain-containing protein [Microbacterium aurantiacum]|uniref:Alpha-L-rhamnosidase N-terminal domain-containing protein n=1 Tax=Microbacterium aurantiacum TaxID=162393 RepID=A0AAJ2HH49_9MICO|nr:alpha-L-rhamnosidase N-terminal domain-containing protein [Microbacterium aurantiacum]MDS0244370.1 alpha-L-rhamnosidase N-terminal domain-containing protein [Microbacterium aurantiacum]